MAETQKIRNDIAKTKEKIAEQQKSLRELEAQLAEEENLEIVRMVKEMCIRDRYEDRRTEKGGAGRFRYGYHPH